MLLHFHISRNGLSVILIDLFIFVHHLVALGCRRLSLIRYNFVLIGYDWADTTLLLRMSLHCFHAVDAAALVLLLLLLLLVGSSYPNPLRLVLILHELTVAVNGFGCDGHRVVPPVRVVTTAVQVGLDPSLLPLPLGEAPWSRWYRLHTVPVILLLL